MPLSREPTLGWKTSAASSPTRCCRGVVISRVNGFIGASLGMVILTSAIKSVPEDYVRAARVDGASSLAIVRHVILPLIRWPLPFVLLNRTLALLTSSEYILLVTGR